MDSNSLLVPLLYETLRERGIHAFKIQNAYIASVTAILDGSLISTLMY